MRFWEIALRNVLRKRLRSLFAMLGIALATAVYVGMTNLVTGIAANWVSHYDEGSVHLLAYQEGQVNVLSSTVPDDMDRAIAQVPGVRAAFGELFALTSMPQGGHMAVSGWDGGASAWDDLDILAGVVPRPIDGARVVLGEGLAEALRLGPGEAMAMLGAEAQVVAVNRTRNPLTGKRALVPLEFLQERMFREGSVTAVNIVLERPGDEETVARIRELLSSRYPGHVLETTEEMVRGNDMIELLGAISSSVTIVALMIGAAGVANVMMMAVFERRSELGLLSAIGWSRKRIFGLITLEGLMLSLPAGILGGLLGLLLARTVSALSPLAAFFATEVSLAQFAAAVAVAVAVGLAGSLYPAARAVTVPADAALRTV